MNKDDFSPETIQKTAFFTGHRTISNEEKPLMNSLIFQSLSSAYKFGYRRFFCGCALGFDTLAALQVVRLRELFPDVRLILAIPCETQADRWNHQDRDTYRQILGFADEKRVLSPFYYQGAMLTRNRYMADRSSLCICWLKSGVTRGGTASSVRYALVHGGIRIVNLAVPDQYTPGRLREKTWNCMYISPSANKNAVTVPLLLSHRRRLIFRNMSD